MSTQMDNEKLFDLLRYTTVAIRKQVETAVFDPDHGTLHVYAMPHVSEISEPEQLALVDLHFFTVGVYKDRAIEKKDDLLAWLNTYPNPETLACGPSYIALGAEIGSQEAAMRLYGLGHALELWEVRIPKDFGVTGADADRAAGNGWVIITGYRRPDETA